MKIKISLDGKEVEAEVTENMGYQGGKLTKAVEYEGKNTLYRNRKILENLGETFKKIGLWRAKL